MKHYSSSTWPHESPFKFLLLLITQQLFGSASQAQERPPSQPATQHAASQNTHPSLTVSFRSLAEVSAFNATVTNTGQDAAAAERKGSEANWCTKDPSVTSEAKASAAGKVAAPASAENVIIHLQLDAQARGGEVRDCVELPEFRGFKVYKKKQIIARKATTSIANASIGADVAIPLSQYSPGEKYELIVDTPEGDLPDHVSLQVSSGNLAIEASPGKRRFILDAGAFDYTASLAIATKAATTGQGQNKAVGVTVTPRLTLTKIDTKPGDPASDVPDTPILETLASGGELEEGFDAVGAISVDGSVWCSGAVVGRYTVLTAAHCIKGEKNWQSHTVAFTLGKNAGAAPAKSIYKVIGWRVPDFEMPSIAYDVLNNSDDIALIYVDRSFNAVGLTESEIPLEPLVLAEDDKPLRHAKEANVRLIGFGYSAPNAPTTGKGERRRIELPPGRISSKTFELANVSRRACKGDSGGPVVYPARHKDTHIVGIVSAGLRSGEQLNLDGKDKSLCYDQSVITRVDIYSKWILKFIDRPPAS